MVTVIGFFTLLVITAIACVSSLIESGAREFQGCVTIIPHSASGISTTFPVVLILGLQSCISKAFRKSSKLMHASTGKKAH